MFFSYFIRIFSIKIFYLFINKKKSQPLAKQLSKPVLKQAQKALKYFHISPRLTQKENQQAKALENKNE